MKLKLSSNIYAKSNFYAAFQIFRSLKKIDWLIVLFLYGKTRTTNNMLQYETVGNVFLVRGCEKTMVQIQETGAVAESAASQKTITWKAQQYNTSSNAEKKKKRVNRENNTTTYKSNCWKTW